MKKHISSVLFYSLVFSQIEYNPEKVKVAFEKSMDRDEPYKLGELSSRKKTVPVGNIIKKTHVSKKIYPGVKRDYWVYVPSQYNETTDASLVIFQDGELYLYGGDVKPDIVFDNLIHSGDMPITIGLFLNPGDKLVGNPTHWKEDDNRSYEYDTMNDLYARFLIEEMFPLLKKDYNISSKPEDVAIIGISSGGICAFNAAWHRPDVFGKVVSHCGSFVNIRGADRYPQIVRESPKKNIKVFLQSGEKDVAISIGSWPFKNKEMADSFMFKGYDYIFVFGKGGHTLMHGGEIFPETMKWIWNDNYKFGKS